MDFALELAHLQLTLRCNLHCPFCGQWGSSGFAKNEHDLAASEMSVAEWFHAIDSIVELSADGKPGFLLWGGEPLLYNGVDQIVREIHRRGFPLAIVTNGSLLERHAAVLGDCLSTLYVSVDGPGAEHDRIRASEGLHTRIERGLSALAGSKILKTGMCVISQSNVDMLPEVALYAERIGFDKIIFQNLIFMLPYEAACYDAWLKGSLGLTSTNVASWTYERIPDFSTRLPGIYTDMERRRSSGDFKIEVEFHPKGISSANVMERMLGNLTLPCTPAHCLASFRHINVAPDGSIRFCVDYNELNLGSLRDRPLREILSSEKAEKFREGVLKGLNPACGRCPWRHKDSYSGI